LCEGKSGVGGRKIPGSAQEVRTYNGGEVKKRVNLCEFDKRKRGRGRVCKVLKKAHSTGKSDAGGEGGGSSKMKKKKGVKPKSHPKIFDREGVQRKRVHIHSWGKNKGVDRSSASRQGKGHRWGMKGKMKKKREYGRVSQELLWGREWAADPKQGVKKEEITSGAW